MRKLTSHNWLVSFFMPMQKWSIQICDSTDSNAKYHFNIIYTIKKSAFYYFVNACYKIITGYVIEV